VAEISTSFITTTHRRKPNCINTLHFHGASLESFYTEAGLRHAGNGQLCAELVSIGREVVDWRALIPWDDMMKERMLM
jgi:hypothetical protein